ncbi:MarR family transcriptional regulator [Gordonia sp. CPCC 206044]|uniref:MarR family winged helix-turn-helix transcriptional regulator n=1 Tax=Gordonia sp. CPCC 206044 TaxID=3140793 RepID=UPI003AF34110
MPSSASPSPQSSQVDDASVETTCATLTGFLDRLACIAKGQTMDTLAAADLTFSQIRVLFALGAHGEDSESMSVHEIAGQVNLSLAAAGRTVDKLVGTGLVDRREDPTDRRVKRVSLTAEGADVVASQVTIKREMLRSFVAGLPVGLRDGLCSALSPIVDSDVDYFAQVCASPSASHEGSPSDNSQKVGS